MYLSPRRAAKATYMGLYLLHSLQLILHSATCKRYLHQCGPDHPESRRFRGWQQTLEQKGILELILNRTNCHHHSQVSTVVTWGNRIPPSHHRSITKNGSKSVSGAHSSENPKQPCYRHHG